MPRGAARGTVRPPSPRPAPAGRARLSGGRSPGKRGGCGEIRLYPSPTPVLAPTCGMGLRGISSAGVKRTAQEGKLPPGGGDLPQGYPAEGCQRLLMLKYFNVGRNRVGAND
ncbi:unnamed protein product [Coccothraustes coccothraustes]